MRFLHSWFPPMCLAWRPMIGDLGGKYVPGSFLNPSSIEFSHLKRQINLTAIKDSECELWHTCFRSPIECKNDLKIAVMKNWPGQKLVEFIVSVTGRKENFLAHYGIEGDGTVISKDTEALKLLFANPELRFAMSSHLKFMIRIGKRPGLSAIREATLLIPQILTNKNQLGNALDLFKRLLDSLTDSGLARPPRQFR